ncbi:hypothetical protein [Alloyangia pacifica]|uniref:hypothetical protein n=1 Tax=Alloyangia pacifica TaxID=311180 RepID=UPI001CFD7BEE|nr:hypothetical protein [Alloyangia pacifica]
MTTTNNKNRDDLMARDYLSGMEIGEIGRSNGLGPRRVQQILKEQGVKMRPRIAKADRSPVSSVHERLGRKLIDFRFDNDLQPNEAANDLGWSYTKLRDVERGLVPIDLLELRDIMTYTKKSLNELTGIR